MLETAELTRIEDDIANIQEVLSFTVQAKVVSNSALDIINAKMGRSDDSGGNLYPHVSNELLKVLLWVCFFYDFFKPSL